jgi:hypothetical protein
MKNTLVISMALAGMLFVVAPVIGLNDVQARICKMDTITSKPARALSLKKAKQRARSKWSRKVKKLYGYSYSSWQLAKYRKYTPTKIAGSWRVLAHARPCRH